MTNESDNPEYKAGYDAAINGALPNRTDSVDWLKGWRDGVNDAMEKIESESPEAPEPDQPNTLTPKVCDDPNCAFCRAAEGETPPGFVKVLLPPHDPTNKKERALIEKYSETVGWLASFVRLRAPGYHAGIDGLAELIATTVVQVARKGKMT